MALINLHTLSPFFRRCSFALFVSIRCAKDLLIVNFLALLFCVGRLLQKLGVSTGKLLALHDVFGKLVEPTGLVLR